MLSNSSAWSCAMRCSVANASAPICQSVSASVSSSSTSVSTLLLNHPLSLVNERDHGSAKRLTASSIRPGARDCGADSPACARTSSGRRDGGRLAGPYRQSRNRGPSPDCNVAERLHRTLRGSLSRCSRPTPSACDVALLGRAPPSAPAGATDDRAGPKPQPCRCRRWQMVMSMLGENIPQTRHPSAKSGGAPQSRWKPGIPVITRAGIATDVDTW